MKKVFLSEEAGDKLKNYLKKKSIDIIEIRKTKAVYPAIASHPDIYICKVKEDMVIESSQYDRIKDHLIGKGYYRGEGSLGEKYPETISYNAVSLGDYFIHHINHTDKKILDLVRDKGMKIIPVKQGYTKCNMVIVDDHSVITSDSGIEKTLLKEGIHVLLINRGQVRLKGFEYGFLGGASGKVGDEIIFNGNLEEHDDFLRIKAFIEARQMKITYFKEYPLEDIGSIIEG